VEVILKFKKWLEGTGQGRAHTEPVPAWLTPYILAKDDAKHGVGGWTRIDLEPLPGNKKPMKKKSKKS